MAGRPGSGTYIEELSSSSAAASIGLFLKLRQPLNTFQNLSEVRFTLEVDIAGLAAGRAGAEDMAAMEAAIEDMAGHIANAEQFVHYDLAFHAALATATHNDLYTVLLTPITDLLLEFRLMTYHYNRQGTIEGGLTHHRRILAQVKSSNAEGARQAMRNHLVQAQNLIDAAYKELKT